MMKDNWLKDIHNRMTDFEMEEPQGLWEDICAAETKGAKTPVIGKGHYRKIWLLTAAAAACLLLMVSFHKDIHQSDTSSATLSSNQNMVAKQIEAAETSVLADALHPRKIAISQSANLVHAEEETITPVNVAITDSAEQKEESMPQRNTPQEQRSGLSWNYGYLAQARKPTREQTRFSVGIVTSGGTGTDNLYLFQGGSMAAAPVKDDAEWIDSPLLGIMAKNKSADTERKVTHHSPVRIGASFAYRLSDRWSLESGISYALVGSDIREGSKRNFIEEEQRLHYVGIPIGVSYKVYSWKNLDVYLSSNMLAELCVYGQSNRKYTLSGNAKVETETKTISSHPLQWSVGTKAGVQYNINHQLAFYLEPGCIYYFDDHSSLETIFKEKPFDFNMNIGVRFSVGKTN